MAISANRKLLNAALLKARVAQAERERRNRAEDERIEIVEKEHRLIVEAGQRLQD